MRATEVIESYIEDTVRLLPRRLRDDVATELRSLFQEELHARAQQSGRPPDESLALVLVRDYGHPNEVAARYQPPLAIIDPADSTSFIRAAIIGAGAVVLMSALRRLSPSMPASSDTLILVWLGLLVVFFGAKNWIRRRSTTKMYWKPRDRDRVNRIGAAFVIPIATVVIVLYAAPTSILDQISGGRFDTSWAAYTEDFQRLRLPCFIGLMVGNLALLAFVAIQGRWRRLTRRIRIGINLALACLILHFALDGNLFQSSQVDQIARNVLAFVAVCYVPFVGLMLYSEIGRINRTSVIKETESGLYE